MHIPDGFLGPQTLISSYAVMIPIWAITSKKIQKKIKSKYIPAIAIGSAFSFVIMMLNIPIPGGSTGHAIGAALLSIIFGPWIGSMLITIALAIQALLFGDGGITSFAVNSLNIAFIPSFTGFYIYKLISGYLSKIPSGSSISAGIAGYVSITMGALATGIILGLQPILNHTDSGIPNYFPYSLNISVPAMLLEHLLVFSWIEGIITALAIGYLVKSKSDLLVSIYREDNKIEN